MASNMVGKMFKIAIGTRESLNKSGKILQQVDCFIDGNSGTLYIVPKEEDMLEKEPLELSIDKIK